MIQLSVSFRNYDHELNLPASLEQYIIYKCANVKGITIS